MSWLLPSVIFNLVAIIILSFTYLYLFYKDRERCTLDWFVAWLLYSVRPGLEAMSASAGVSELYRPFIELFTVASALFLIRGTSVFTNRPINKSWYIGGVLAIISSFVNYIYDASDVYIYPILAFYFKKKKKTKAETYTGRISKVLALVFLVWGVHKFNYPFLRYLENYVRVGICDSRRAYFAWLR